MMEKYIKPSYVVEGVETEDVILASIMVKDGGVAVLGSIEGEKGLFEADYNDIFALR